MSQRCRICCEESAEKNYIELEQDFQSVDITNKIEFCLPEMDLSLTSKPVICVVCVSKLNNAYALKKDCMETERYIKKFYFGLGLSTPLELKDICRYNNERVENANVPVVENEAVVHTASVERTAVVEDLNNLLDDVLNERNYPECSIEIEEHTIKIEDDDEDDVIFLEENLLVPKETEDEPHCLEAPKTANDTTVKKRRGRRPKMNNLPDLLPPANGDWMKPINCEYCNFTSKNFESLLSHIACHQDIVKGDGKPYFCPLCNMRSKWKVVIINHLKIHNINIPRKRAEKKEVKCDKCPFITSSKRWKRLLDMHTCKPNGI